MRDQIDGEQIVFVGEANAQRKRELYRRRCGRPHAAAWEEPFGLVMPEAMACGTPVIAFRRGSAPELILHNETGFVVDTVDEMVDAVAAIPSIDAARCREHVAANFSPHIMANNYIRLYETMLAGQAAASRTGSAHISRTTRHLPVAAGSAASS